MSEDTDAPSGQNARTSVARATYPPSWMMRWAQHLQPKEDDGKGGSAIVLASPARSEIA